MAYIDTKTYKLTLYSIGNGFQYNKSETEAYNIASAIIKDKLYAVEIEKILVERTDPFSYTSFKEKITGISIPAFVKTYTVNRSDPKYDLPAKPIFAIIEDNQKDKTLSLEEATDEEIDAYLKEHPDKDSYTRSLEVIFEAAEARFNPDKEMPKAKKKLFSFIKK